VLSVSPVSRSVLAAVGVAFLLAMVTVGRFPIVATIISAVCLVAAGARDLWVFDPHSRCVMHRRGWLGFSRDRRFRADEISTLRVKELGSSLGRFQFVALELVSHDDSITTIEVQKRRNDQLIEWARRISGSLGIPLQEEL
jgi:hypothetical protein